MNNNRIEMKNNHSILQDKIVAIEFAIQNVSKLRNDLDENSILVKSEVQKSVSLQLDQLRQREMQLLRQVDALINHQSDMLQLQLSKLYQVLGRFKAASQWGTEDELALKMFNISDEDVTTVSTRHIHYLPNYEKELASAISSFGRFEAKGAPRNVLLLPEEEEYGDGDHHVLHKTLQADNNGKIKVCFPKLSTKPEYWLLSSSSKENDFDMCETLSNKSSNKSGSIELLSYPDLDDNHMWLHPNNKTSCSCQDMGDVEIENLDSLICVPVAKPIEPPIIAIPKVASICCKSNGTKKCSSFEECICEESCLITSLKGQLKKQHLSADFQQQDCINEAIKEAFKLNEPKQWLIKDKSNTSDKWLANNCKSTEDQDGNNKKSVPVSEDKWLMINDSSNSLITKKFKMASGKRLENSSVWLLNESNDENCSINEERRKIVAKEKCKMEIENADFWLLNSAGSKGQSSINRNTFNPFDLFLQSSDNRMTAENYVNKRLKNGWF